MADKTIDMGDYQVVADMRTPECSLRVLRLSSGKTINHHIHRKTTQVYFVIKGDIVATIAGENRNLGYLESVRVPNNTPHAIATESAAVVLSISTPPLRLDDQIVV